MNEDSAKVKEHVEALAKAGKLDDIPGYLKDEVESVDPQQRAGKYNHWISDACGEVFRQYILSVRRVEDVKWLRAAPKGWEKTIEDAIRGSHLQRTVDALIAQVERAS